MAEGEEEVEGAEEVDMLNTASNRSPKPYLLQTVSDSVAIHVQNFLSPNETCFYIISHHTFKITVITFCL